MRSELTKYVYLNFQRFEMQEGKNCPKCGEKMFFIRRCCGDNEVWVCENCNYTDKEISQNIWYYYIWAK
ncbi:hypothetical protein [Candidatus Chrysopegis kryptomonas]|uniref:Uncharacterized protein n=1 Tax=Candidatus Chryseopegocella kryptomonas TaxID=1633643 RepID=A0A0P1NV87_9BACT|nr:hypothetical protein [Candidatus Chrysopegis kryptomonas]CUT02729.1 hypothetical protein JGI23_01324 [Candidatus Chrysopegis kryptomonas]